MDKLKTILITKVKIPYLIGVAALGIVLAFVAVISLMPQNNNGIVKELEDGWVIKERLSEHNVNMMHQGHFSGHINNKHIEQDLTDTDNQYLHLELMFQSTKELGESEEQITIDPKVNFLLFDEKGNQIELNEEMSDSKLTLSPFDVYTTNLVYNVPNGLKMVYMQIKVDDEAPKLYTEIQIP